MSSNFNYTMGLGHVGSFQTSARPFLTSSLNIPGNSSAPLVIQFETVSRFIIISNTSLASNPARPFRFGFSVNGINAVENNNYVILANGETFEAEFKVSEVYLISDTTFAATGSVVAGLTGIDRRLLSSNFSGSSGVG